MILRPQNLENLLGQLRQVPEEKRKIIVLVGKHPNEGTINIAVRHHASWEKYGAVVIQIPHAWTPHSVWTEALKTKKRSGRLATIRQVRNILSDSTLIRKLAAAGFRSPIVNFHGSPGQNTSITSKTEMLYNVDYDTGLPAHPLFAPRYWFKKGEELGKMVLRVEYVYPAARTNTANFGRLLKQVKRGIRSRRLRSDLDGSLSPKYLGHARINREALTRFDHEHAKNFEDILLRLSESKSSS